MRSFEAIYAIAAERKGGTEALEALLEKPLPHEEVATMADDRWLSSMARSLFEAGFNWKVIDAKWEGFEAAFDGFATRRVAHYHDGEIDRLLGDDRIVRNGAKVMAVIDNARFICGLAAEHGSAGRFFAEWPDTDFVGLLEVLTKRGARLGGVTGQRMLRRVGRTSFVLSPDVVARLVAEGIVAKAPCSRHWPTPRGFASSKRWQAASRQWVTWFAPSTSISPAFRGTCGSSAKLASSR